MECSQLRTIDKVWDGRQVGAVVEEGHQAFTRIDHGPKSWPTRYGNGGCRWGVREGVKTSRHENRRITRRRHVVNVHNEER